MLSQAWNSVTEKTISNCFRQADFTPSSPPPPPETEQDDGFDLDNDIPLSRLQDHGLDPDILQQFTDADHQLQTCAELTDEDILEEVRMNKEYESTPADDNHPDDRPAPISTRDEVLRACDTIRAYLQKLSILQHKVV